MGSREGSDGLVDLPAEAIVLRGGQLLAPSREQNLQRVRTAYGLWGICVKAEPRTTAADIARRGNLQSKRMMVGLTGELNDAGFRVVEEPGRRLPSALILFPEEPNEAAWHTLREVMLKRPMRDNPAYKRK